MDAYLAGLLASDLKGKIINGWKIGDLINFGKSAAVFRGTNDGVLAAVKIFDQELIERFGKDSQISRIERELSLTGYNHPNLIQILDGGHCNDRDLHFIVMELIEGENIKDALHKIPFEKIPALIHQLSNAAKFLEKNDLAHRDIKPENIVINSDYANLVLLDLGVIRPFGDGSLTDEHGIQHFIGTLQYSSPEFLLRQEEDTKDGWRALTFYQIGAVLHDLIMRKPIFEEYSQPYAKLVNAVQQIHPKINSADVDQKIIDLAKMCLIKDPKTRINLVNWGSFDLISGQSENRDPSVKQRVTNRLTLLKARSNETVTIKNDDEINHVLENNIKIAIRSISSNSSMLPPVQINHDTKGKTFTISFSKSTSMNFQSDLFVFIKTEILDTGSEIIGLNGLFCFEELKPEELDFSTSKVIFNGANEFNSIYSALEEYIYTALEQAIADCN